jgi:uncharacterized protein YlaI
MSKCFKCGKEITNNEVGLTKKLINRSATEYMCIECMANYFGVSVERLNEKVEEFISAGCTLFEKNK